MNNFCAVGRLTADPEFKKTPAGVSLCRFTLAIERPFKDKDGNKITDFIPCQAWRQTADYMQQYTHKGDTVSILGELHSEKYTDKQTGQQRNRYGIVCSAVNGIKRAEPQTAQGQQAAANIYQQRQSPCAANVNYNNYTAGQQQKSNSQRGNFTPAQDRFIEIDNDGDLPF